MRKPQQLTRILDQLMLTPENQTHESGLRQIVRVCENYDAEHRKISENEELTDLGKREGFKRLRETCHAALEPHEQALERRADALAETKRQALERPPATAESIALDREVRDRIMASGDDKTKVSIRYFNALHRGDDAFCRAVENAPGAYSLLSADTRAKGEASRLKSSPLASEIAEQEHAHQLYLQMVLSTKTEIGKTAQRF